MRPFLHPWTSFHAFRTQALQVKKPFVLILITMVTFSIRFFCSQIVLIIIFIHQKGRKTHKNK